MNLLDYTTEVRAIATKGKTDLTTAVDMFITNLTTMREFNAGTGTLNYHTLGQAWNKLKYSEKLEQRKQMYTDLSSTTRRRGAAIDE